jgi:ATP-dependent Clp protease ATP-binding subunit ClpC
VVERLTPQSIRVLRRAHDNARTFGSPFVEPDHLLLGLAEVGGGIANEILARVRFRQDDALRQIAGLTMLRKMVCEPPETVSPEAEQVLEFAAEEADRLGHSEIGPEHLLLGILREERSVAALVLMDQGLFLDDVREDVAALKRASLPN